MHTINLWYVPKPSVMQRLVAAALWRGHPSHVHSDAGCGTGGGNGAHGGCRGIGGALQECFEDDGVSLEVQL